MLPPSNLTFEMNGSTKSGMCIFNTKDDMINKIQSTISNNEKVTHSVAPSMDVMFCRSMDDN